jgi:hypothetical protein
MVAALAFAGLAALLLAALALPWRLSIALSARGAADGGWALAGGAQLAGLAATYSRARDVPGALGVHLLGRRVLQRQRKASTPGAAKAAPPRRARTRGLPRWIDPIDLALFVVGERRRVAIRELDASVRLGLHDVALAGELSGLLAVLSALAAPFGRLRHEVDWSGDESLEASVSATLRFSPALLLWDTSRFVARSMRGRRRRLPRDTAALPQRT